MIKLEFPLEKAYEEKIIKKYSSILANKMKDIDLKEHNLWNGWMKIDKYITPQVIKNIQTKTNYLLNNLKVDTLVVIGVGGSYTGSRAIIEGINGLYPKNQIEIIYLGTSLSGLKQDQIIKYLNDKNYCINVISKSGTTLETKTCYQKVKNHLLNKFGKGAYKRIVVTTDKEKGELIKEAKKHNLTKFEIPRDIGGRYSVSTAVGLFPMAMANLDIEEFIKGVNSIDFNVFDEQINSSIIYAMHRYHQMLNNKEIEIFASYEPQFEYLGKWFQQLFAESEGKDGKGIFPACVTYSSDLHSIGQMIQDGKRMFFETVLYVKNLYPEDHLNEIARVATSVAHHNGGVPVSFIQMNELNEYNFGAFIQWTFYSCVYSSALLGVNPFDQPGVEDYKSEIRKRQ